MNLKRRLRALEQQIKPPEEPLRVVVCHPGEPADLKQAECHRRILENGRLMEVVTLYGSDDGISKEDLDRFVAKFPISPISQDGVCCQLARIPNESHYATTALAGGPICALGEATRGLVVYADAERSDATA